MSCRMSLELSKKVSHEVLRCELCPHYCHLKPFEVGKCYARFNNSEDIVHMNLGAISSLAVESISKKPFKRFLPGTKTLTLGGYGCNLNCEFCENHKISQVSPIEGSKVWSPDELVVAAIDKHCESITMSYNEPILSYEFILPLADACHDNGIQFALKTNAFINKYPWEQICLRTDAMNIDWKGSDLTFASITKARTFVLKDRIKEAYDNGVHIEISVPLYYSKNEYQEQMDKLGHFLKMINRDIPCHLLRISPSYHYDSFISDPEDIKKAQSILSSYLANIYIVI